MSRAAPVSSTERASAWVTLATTSARVSVLVMTPVTGLPPAWSLSSHCAARASAIRSSG